MTTPVLYLLMRNDIPSMNPGKLAAQAAHVANQFVHDLRDPLKYKNRMAAYSSWVGDRGFGTTLTLGASKKQLVERFQRFQYGTGGDETWMYGRVFDPTYPCYISREVAEYLYQQMPDYVIVGDSGGTLLRREMVGVYLFGDKEDPQVQQFVEGLHLYP
jgi:hypothetical protein